MSLVIFCPVQKFVSGGKSRRFLVFTTTVREARQHIKSVPYSACTGEGEQRQINETHVKKILRDMREGEYTPACFAASVPPAFQKGVLITKDEKGKEHAKIKLEDGENLHLPDGGHRLEAIERLIREYREAAKKAPDYKEAKRLNQLADELEESDLLFIVYLDGDPQIDFVKLQLGKTIDASHLLTMKVLHELIEGKEGDAMRYAFEIANVEVSSKESPFYKAIRFDSNSRGRNPIASLCTKGVDQAGSFYGMARLGLKEGWSPNRMCVVVHRIAQAVPQKAPGLCNTHESPLSHPNNGTRGSVALLLGLSILAIYKAAKKDQTTVTDADVDRLLEVANKHLAEGVEWNATKKRRAILGRMAADFLADLGELTHEGVPLGLLEVFPPGCYGLSPMPRKKRGKKPTPVQPSRLPATPPASSTISNNGPSVTSVQGAPAADTAVGTGGHRLARGGADDASNGRVTVGRSARDVEPWPRTATVTEHDPDRNGHRPKHIVSETAGAQREDETVLEPTP
jgi:hypothetical protein